MRPPVLGATVPEVGAVDRVRRAADERPFQAEERQVVSDGEPVVIEQDVVVRAKAEQVARRVGAAVGPPERAVRG
jgi:hypothetical protein